MFVGRASPSGLLLRMSEGVDTLRRVSIWSGMLGRWNGVIWDFTGMLVVGRSVGNYNRRLETLKHVHSFGARQSAARLQ